MSSLPSITTAATALSSAHGRHPSLLSAFNEKIEVEDFEIVAGFDQVARHMRAHVAKSDETDYWLELLVASNATSKQRMTDLQDECNQLIAILTTISKNLKKK